MWRTAVQGDFVTKDQAAEWAIPLLSPELADILEHARLAYLGKVVDNWVSRAEEVEKLARDLVRRLKQVL